MSQSNNSNPPSNDREPRRRALKTLGVGALLGTQAAPEQWMKPVVSSIIMPAHAQTSPGQVPDYEINIQEVFAGVDGGGIFFGGEISTEAPTSQVTASVIIETSGIVEGESGDPLVFPLDSEGNDEGFYFFETSIEGEADSSTEISLDFDIGDDGVIDDGVEIAPVGV